MYTGLSIVVANFIIIYEYGSHFINEMYIFTFKHVIVDYVSR